MGCRDENIVIKFQDLQKSKTGLRVKVQKRIGGKILEANYLMTETMTHNILLTRKMGGKKCLITGGGVPRDLVYSCYVQKEEERMTPTLPLSYDYMFAACTYLLLNVMRSKRFLLHLILTLS